MEPVVAIGDGLVVAPPEAATTAPSTGSWVAALGDCLEERAAGRFQVVDRVAPGETARTARERVGEVRELGPSVVVVGLGARELGAEKPDAGRFRKEMTRLVRELVSAESTPRVLLVGMIPPTLDQAEAAEKGQQGRLDELAVRWNGALAELAASEAQVEHVDLWSDWPRAADLRAGLTALAWELSDPGHARVAAAVCDAVID